MNTRTLYIGLIVTVGGFLCSLLLSGWSWWQIYGLGGWRDEVNIFVGTQATQQAMDDFREGHIRLYTLSGENEASRSTGRRDGAFEVWTYPFAPALGHAHRYAKEQFIEFYNRKMRYMHSHPDKFTMQQRNSKPKPE